MSDEMQNDAIKLAKEAFQIEYKDNISKVDFSKIHIAKGHVAGYIKKKFDDKYNPTWHCVVGTKAGYGFSIDHCTKTGKFVDFDVGSFSIYLFNVGLKNWPDELFKQMNS